MNDADYLALKAEVTNILDSGVTPIAFAEEAGCTPSALKGWLEGDVDPDLSTSIKNVVVKHKAKQEVLHLPVLDVTSSVFIKKVVVEAMFRPQVYALIGAKGNGKTATLLDCAQFYDGVHYFENLKSLDSDLSVGDYEAICIDNVEHLTEEQEKKIGRLVDRGVGVVLAGMTSPAGFSSDQELNHKTVLRYVPGIDQEDVSLVLNEIFPDLKDQNLIKQVGLVTLPSIAFLALFLKEAYRILKSRNETKLNMEIINEAKGALINGGSKW